MQTKTLQPKKTNFRDERQRRMLVQLASECITDEEIALQLGVPVRTVRYYMGYMKQRYGAYNRMDLVRRAMQKGHITSWT